MSYWPTRRVVDANARACESLGYVRDELVGATHDLFTTLATDRVAELSAAVNAGEAVEFEDVHRRKDGTTFPVEVLMEQVPVALRRWC